MTVQIRILSSQFLPKNTYDDTTHIITLNAPISTKVVCFTRLLICLKSLYGKQCGPRSDCSILNEMNNGQPIPLMWLIFILLFFKILALENIAKILTTGPRLREWVYNHACRLSHDIQIGQGYHITSHRGVI